MFETNYLLTYLLIYLLTTHLPAPSKSAITNTVVFPLSETAEKLK